MAFLHNPPPKYAPQRDTSWNTEGGELRKIARALGREPMPWQQLVYDTATEWRTFGPGESENDVFLGQRRYRYSRVLVTVPRQSGKTAGMAPVRIHRLLTRPGLRAFSTAQTGKDAGKRMQDLIQLVVASPLAPFFKSRFSIGSEGLSVPANGASLTRFAPKADALHGETPEHVDYDEIWVHSREQGAALEGAVSPAQITLHGRSQVWYFSTMGTAGSGWLNDMVEVGRAGTDPSLAYFEWSLPDDADAYDPAAWWTFHPALGNTIAETALAEEAGRMSYSEWMRAYCNRRVETVDALIPAEDFADLAGELEPPAWSDVTIAYDVAPGNASAALYAVWRDDAGRPCAHVVHAAGGTAWLADLVETIWRTHKPRAIAGDDGGETRPINDELSRRGVPVQTTTRDFGTACMQLLTAARDERTLRHDGSENLRRAVMHAVIRPVGDSWRFSRAHSTGPIAALIAVAVGLWVHDHAEQLGPPVIYFGSEDAA